MGERIYSPQVYPYSVFKNSCGVYQIRNLVNGHLYVGSSRALGFRRTQHFSDLRCQRHHSSYLQRAFNKYGEENFIFEVIEFCDNNDQFTLEQYWIDKLSPPYNVSPIATAPSLQYGKKNYRAHSVICLETEKIYDTIVEAEKDTGISRSSITNACLGKTSTAYGMHWLYYEDYINKTPEDIKEILLKVPDDPLSVVCLETREVYSSIVKASKAHKVNKGNISLCCLGKRRTAGEKHWVYLSDYKNMTESDIQNICNYQVGYKIICLETSVVYDHSRDAERKLGLDSSTIIKCCKGKLMTIHGLHFMYLREYEKLTEEEIQQKLNNRRYRKIKCLETGEIYKSLSEVTTTLHLGYKTVKDTCLGLRKSAGGYHFTYV